ncbi:MAG: folate-binding protein YgfZ [Herminiimonas sp.]|nr:folate-binding protein YgfZ [Herminiimonas sp.]
MQSWLTFLKDHGALEVDPQTRAISGFAGAIAVTPPSTDFVVPLTAFGLIAANGAEAATFLHNQLTNDVENLGTDEVRLAGYCTPKGRLLATFLLWKTGDTIYLQLPLELQATIQKRLQMFIMRAKATLTDADQQTIQLGLAGSAASAALSTWFPVLPAAPHAKVDSAAGSLMRLADSRRSSDAAPGVEDVPLYLWTTDGATAQAAWPTLIARLQPASAAAWQLAQVRAGIASITAATQEKFVPQMVNFEAVGGVNFQKGCYPGQEIVARSQYLGKLKRRMMPATVAAEAIAPGTEVFAETDPDQACGMVVNAAPVPGGSDCLVEIKLAALESPVHLGTIDGPLLQFHALPYVLGDADRPDLR